MHCIINIYFVTRLGDVTVIAGYTLGNMVFEMICVLGGITAQSSGTLISQAYGSADTKRMCAVYYNRQLFLNSIYCFLLAVPMLFIDSIFLAIHLDSIMVKHATIYVHMMIPVIWLAFQQQTSSVYALS